MNEKKNLAYIAELRNVDIWKEEGPDGDNI
jgi:hypothetical protein